MDGLTILDIILSIIFLYFILHGYNRGFINQTSTILGLLVALYMGIRYYERMQMYIAPYLELSGPLLQFIAFAIVFVVFNIAIHVLGRIVRNILNMLFLQPLDRVAGALLGFIKGIILMYLVVLVLAQVPYQGVEQMMASSYLADNILEMTPLIQKSLEDIFKRP